MHRNIYLKYETLFKFLKKAADRYIKSDEATVKVRQFNENGIKCALEFIGESTLNDA